MKVTRCRLWLYGVWAVCEVLVLGALVYGWPSLVFLLKQRHVFGHHCQPGDITSTPASHNNRSLLLSGRGEEDTPDLYDLTITEHPENESFEVPRPQHLVQIGLHKDASGNSSGTRPTGTSSTPLTAVGTPFPSDSDNKFYDNSNNNFIIMPTSMTVWPLREVLDGSVNESGWSGAGEDYDWSDSHGGELQDGCGQQDAAFALSYTVVTAVTAMGSVVIGHAQRILGMRKTRIVSGLMYMAGLVMVGFITPDRPALLYTGMSCVAISGLCLLVTNLQLGPLYGSTHSTFVGLLSGCYDVSAISQLLIKVIISSGADYLFTYVSVAGLSSLTLVSALLWLPDGPVVVPHSSDRLQKMVIAGKDDGDTRRSFVTSTKLTSSLLSALYVLHVLWFAFLQLRLIFFVGVLNTWLTVLTDGDTDQVDHYTSVQLYTGCGSVLFAIMAGCLYDFQRHRYKDSASRELVYLGSAVVPLATGSVLCTLVSVLCLVGERGALYVLFVLLAAFRSVMYSLAAAFLAHTFPAELFGVLYGVMIICAGVISCVQYPLFLWAHTHHNIFHVNGLLLATTLLTFIHPLHLLYKCRRSQPPFSPAQLPAECGPHLQRLTTAYGDLSPPETDFNVCDRTFGHLHTDIV